MSRAFGVRAASSGARGTIGKPDFPIAVGGKTKPSGNFISTYQKKKHLTTGSQKEKGEKAKQCFFSFFCALKFHSAILFF